MHVAHKWSAVHTSRTTGLVYTECSHVCVVSLYMVCNDACMVNAHMIQSCMYSQFIHGAVTCVHAGRAGGNEDKGRETRKGAQ